MLSQSASSTLVITTAFVALLMLLLLTFADAVSASGATPTTLQAAVSHSSRRSSESHKSDERTTPRDLRSSVETTTTLQTPPSQSRSNRAPGSPDDRSTTTLRRLQTVWPTKSQRTTVMWPKLMVTTWPAILLDRTSTRHADVASSRKSETTDGGGQQGITPARHRTTSYRRVVGPTSPWRVIRTGFPTTPGPSRRYLTSPPVTFADGPVIHCHVQLGNDYDQMLNESGSSSHIYGRELGAGIAQLFRVDEPRISDVNVFEQPNTGRMIVRFNINPALRSCRWSCFSNTSQIADAAERLVNSYSFNLTDIGSRTLYVDQLPAFYSWTDKPRPGKPEKSEEEIGYKTRHQEADDGPCPNASCSSPGEVCSLDLSGEFSCQCASNCVSEETTEMQPHSNDNLWALFVIPFVVVIVLFVLLILVVLKRQKTRKIGVKSLRDYKPSYDIETLKQQPMLATLDPAAANRLAHQLECQIGIAYNDRSFDNASYSGTVISPLSTVRVNTLPDPTSDGEK